MTQPAGRMRDLDLFSSLDDEQLARLAADATEVTFAAGDTMIVQGADSRECYVILTGRAEISARNRGGVVDTVGEGEAVGEMALILGWERTATVTAIEPITAIAVSREVLKANPEINDALTRYLYAKIEDIELGGGTT